jgi:hypothetical protein
MVISTILLILCYFWLHIYYQNDLVFGLYAIHDVVKYVGDPTDFEKSVTLGS